MSEHYAVCDAAGPNREEGDCEMTFCICGERWKRCFDGGRG